jgi:hypothetical protein
MFNSLGRTLPHRVTTRQPQHHSHRCPSFQVQRKAPSSPKSTPPLGHFEPQCTDFANPTLAAIRPPRVELPTVTPSAETQVQRITHLYPPSSKKETRLNLNYPPYPTPIHFEGITRQTSGSSDPTYQALTLFSPRGFSAATFCSKAARPEK